VMQLPPRGRPVAVVQQAAVDTPADPVAASERAATFAGPRTRIAPSRTGAPQVRRRSAERTDQAAALRRILASATAARTAVLAAEVLGAPRALREHDVER